MAPSGSPCLGDQKVGSRRWWRRGEVSQIRLYPLRACKHLVNLVISPLMSMISHIAKSPSQSQPTVQFLYASRCPTSGNLSSILFHSRLRSIFDLSLASQSRYQLYLTGATVSKLNQSASDGADPVAVVHHRRINHDDLVDALGPVSEREAVVAYVCGPPAMTDEFVTLIRDAPGMDATRVFCEKWW